MQPEVTRDRKRWRCVIATLVLLGLAAVPAACGGSDAGSGTADTGSSAGSEYLEAVEARVDELLGPKGTYESPPTSGPPVEPNRKIALISCGQNIPSCTDPMASAREAAEAIGWETTLFDTKGDPTAAGAGIRNAIVEGVDAIFMYYIDCEYVRGPLEQAQRAGIAVVTALSVDCDYGDTGADPLFTAEVLYRDGPSMTDYLQNWAAAQAEYAIAELDGEVNMLAFADNTTTGSRVQMRGLEEAIDRCPDCEISIDFFPISALSSGLQARAQQQLLKRPEVNTVAVAYAAIALAGVEPAVRASGRDVLFDIAEASGEAAMDLVRSRPGMYGAGLPGEWEGYAGIDTINRVLNGEEAENSGIGIQLFDADHNTPAEGTYEPPIDFRAAYRKAWGVD